MNENHRKGPNSGQAIDSGDSSKMSGSALTGLNGSWTVVLILFTGISSFAEELDRIFPVDLAVT